MAQHVCSYFYKPMDYLFQLCYLNRETQKLEEPTVWQQKRSCFTMTVENELRRQCHMKSTVIPTRKRAAMTKF
jgi:hypothetical protein